MHIRKRTALHATQCLPCTCTACGYHALVDLILSTLRRNLRSLSEVPSTLRRNLRSIAVSFFLPCEHSREVLLYVKRRELRREQVSGLESTASRVLAPDFYAEMRFSTLWHTQRKCVRICWVSITACRKLPNMEGENPSTHST